MSFQNKKQTRVRCYACEAVYDAARHRADGRGRTLERFSRCRCGAINSDRAGAVRLAAKSSKQRRARA